MPDLSRIEFHCQNPSVSLEQYMREKCCQLGGVVTSVQRIYLDQRFWLLLRDVSIGRNQDEDLSDLLGLLRSLVGQGRAICPISETVFYELTKQSDESTRLATAKLIDELSLGVTLVPFNERVRQELCCAFYKYAGVTDLIPLQHLVWTKLAYTFGEVHPTNMPFSPEINLAVQKAFSDHIWGVSLSEIIDYIGEPPDSPDWDALAARLNAGKKENQSTIRSYTQAFRTEFEGSLELFRNDMNFLLQELDERGYKEFGAELAQLSNKKKFEAFSQSIPSLHINAACHAAVRWDRKRNLCGNDLFDFHHALAALAYCDAFLTEKPLSDMLSQRHLGLSIYKCQIFWSPSEALNNLKSFGS
ncbi:MAG: hypothetical protein SF172_14145 [Burkholderiales bacterium]|nr:hypothetical protein [Burkholderiales bacterium]